MRRKQLDLQKRPRLKQLDHISPQSMSSPFFTIGEAASIFFKIQEDNVSFSITLAAHQQFPAVDFERELIELDLTAPTFIVPSPYYDADDDHKEHISSLSIEHPSPYITAYPSFGRRNCISIHLRD